MNLKIVVLVLLILSSHISANSAIVFMYHRFGETTHPSTNITMEQFGFQLDYLQKNNYNVWPFSKIIRYISEKKPLPPKTVALTIDDAYISTYTKAYPILKKKNFPFTVILSTNPVDNRSSFYMSWDQMREMKKNGAEFANHSLTHEFRLQREDESGQEWKERMTYEIQKAQSRLQEELGEDTNENPRIFSYPFGEYDRKTTELLKELGYAGVTQTSGPIGEDSDIQRINRFPMAEAFASPEGFITKLNTLPMPIESVSPKGPLLEENPPKLYIKLKRPIENINCYLSNGEKIELKWLSSREFEISAEKEIEPPREKYTCTASAGDGKWYWYSHLWIVK